MLKDYQTYVPGKTPVAAQDMNTGGEVVRLLRNINIPGMMLDSMGLYVRRLAFKAPALTTPQYQGQSYVGTADNVAGWDFTPVVAELT
jgi:hypothetical protein